MSNSLSTSLRGADSLPAKSRSWSCRSRWPALTSGRAIAAAATSDETTWELTPYRVHVLVGISPQITPREGLMAELASALSARAGASSGAVDVYRGRSAAGRARSDRL